MPSTSNRDSQANPQPNALAVPAAAPIQRSTGQSALDLGQFDQPVILKQSPRWSRMVVWVIVVGTATSILAACLFKVEEAIPAQGKLEPKAAVKDVQAPVGGVVEDILVEEGERVDPGEVLVSFDPTASQAQLESLQQIRGKLVQENEFYRGQLRGEGGTATPAEVSPEFTTLTKNRATLAAENQVYEALLRGEGALANLDAAQLARLRASNSALQSQVESDRLEIEQRTQQLNQTDIQLENARKSLALDQKIFNQIGPLYDEGGVSELQYLNQEREVNTRQAEVDSLLKEQERLRSAIDQAEEQLQNTVAVAQDDLLNRIATNDQRIAEIDSQLTKVILENEKQIQEVDSQLSQTQLNLTYQDLTAPVGGTVFDLQAQGPGFVVSTSEPILKIVPNDSLVARVFITNQDIGFIRNQFDQANQNPEKTLEVDVRIDSFPYSEFGDVKGEIIRLGSDALPPNEVYPFYRFPAEIRLTSQSIEVENQDIKLQSGMSVSANIKLRKRPIITFLTDLFTRKVDSLRSP